jgi:GT2 family glycosyltransferase
MNNPLVSINIVVLNGERYIRHCLSAITQQTYQNIEVTIFDNASTDGTAQIVRQEFPQFTLVHYPKNLGMWPGHEEALRHSAGKYVLCVSVDVMIDPQFVERAVTISEANPRLGAIQAKIYQYEFPQLTTGEYQKNTTIDTCGFFMFRSRRVGNVGHGMPDGVEYSHPKEIFGVEGAVPFFRREALESLRMDGTIWDHDYFWYGDDLDVAWRMNLFGWKQWYAPDVIAYHDRSTTKGMARGWLDTLGRVGIRRRIPLKKRRLDWSNTRFTIIKNDYIINILRDMPYIALREAQVFVYSLLFEPGVFLELGRFLKLLPRMLAKRRGTMRRATVLARDMHRWFSP